MFYSDSQILDGGIQEAMKSGQFFTGLGCAILWLIVMDEMFLFLADDHGCVIEDSDWLMCFA